MPAESLTSYPLSDRLLGMKPLKLHTGYMRAAFKNIEEVQRRLVYTVEEDHDIEYDTLVGMGLSGSLIIPRLAERLDKHWLIVRKDGDGSHSDSPAEGTLGSRWLFVDDLISSGLTYRRVRLAVRNLADDRKHETEHVGAYLYEGDYFEWPPPRPSPPRQAYIPAPVDPGDMLAGWIDRQNWRDLSLKSVASDFITYTIDPAGIPVDWDVDGKVD